MANVSVTYQEMQQQASKLNNGRADIESKLSELQAQVNNLVSGGFVTDTASGQFQASFESFKKGATEVISGLDGMADYLNKAATTFQEADQQLARTLKS